MRLCQSALLTDLYQLTMLQTYRRQNMEQTAVFELFVRRLPPERGFLLAAGPEQALEFNVVLSIDTYTVGRSSTGVTC